MRLRAKDIIILYKVDLKINFETSCLAWLWSRTLFANKRNLTKV